MLKKNKAHREKYHPNGYIEWFAVHEVYYNNRGKPNGVTQDPIKVIMDEFSKKEFNWVMKHMKQAGTRPILDYEYFEKQGRKKRENETAKSSNRVNKKSSKGK